MSAISDNENHTVLFLNPVKRRFTNASKFGSPTKHGCIVNFGIGLDREESVRISHLSKASTDNTTDARPTRFPVLR